MNPVKWAIRPIKRYADFSGRAPRAEYWWYILAASLFGALVGALDKKFFSPVIGVSGPLALLGMLALVVPGLAVDVRRFHDINRSGWWVLLNVWGLAITVLGMMGKNYGSVLEGMPSAAALPVGGAAVICLITKFVFMVTPGTDGSNNYGADPYGPDELEVVFA